jgi:hypothetical protein
VNDILRKRLVLSEHALSSPVGDETVILHTRNGTYFGLDPIATQVWALLKDGAHPPQICAQISRDYDVDPAVVEQDVASLLSELERNGVLSAVDPTSG